MEVLAVESPVKLFEGSGGTAESVPYPGPELDLKGEPNIAAVEVTVLSGRVSFGYSTLASEEKASEK